MALKAEDLRVGDIVRLRFMSGTEDLEVTEVVDEGETMAIRMESFVVAPISDVVRKDQDIRVMNRNG